MASIKGLYAIVDPSVTPECDPLDLARSYLLGGASILQLRDKKRRETSSAYRRFVESARGIISLKEEFSFLFLVNDDLEVARALDSQADGIHVGQDDPSIESCRESLGPGKLIGYSSHSLEEALEAERRGADYVAFGAIYPTPTKGPGHPVQGLERLKEVVKALRIPVVAIGGIGRHNIEEVLATGVASVAMISALAQARDQAEEARFFSRFFGQ